MTSLDHRLRVAYLTARVQQSERRVQGSQHRIEIHVSPDVEEAMKGWATIPSPAITGNVGALGGFSVIPNEKLPAESIEVHAVEMIF